MTPGSPSTLRWPPWSLTDGLALLVVVGATWLAFRGVASHAFLNWDDPQALVHNEALVGPEVVRWAFTTTHMSHYQPLSWLAWVVLRRAFGAGAFVHHAASLLLHLLNAALVFLLARRLAVREDASRPAAQRVVALGAALAFGLHPLRVEPVAWASALPYLLALTFLVGSTLAYLAFADPAPSNQGPSFPGRRFLALSVLLYAASLLSRPAAPAFPLVLLVLDGIRGRRRSLGWRVLLVEKIPYAALATLATIAEAGARRFVPLERAGLGARLSDAVTAPFVYLWRTLWPVGLSPLDLSSLDPSTSRWALLLGGLLAGLTLWAFRSLQTHSALGGAWVVYLLLLGPAAGLTPSGLQATADRYSYLPGVVIALLAGAGLARAFVRHRVAASLLGVALATMLTLLTQHQLAFWRDSVTLWTRTLQIDPSNDVAAYNLALALEERRDFLAAEAGYRQLLERIPEHGPARNNLRRLEAVRLEHEGGAEAAAGHLEQAVARYTQALERDPARLHSRRSRGMALAQLGRFAEAIPDLTAAVAAPDAEPAVAGALAFALLETRQREAAAHVLRAALSRHPADPGLLASLSALETGATDK